MKKSTIDYALKIAKLKIENRKNKENDNIEEIEDDGFIEALGMVTNEIWENESSDNIE